MTDERKASILVVDDEIDTCRNLADILEEFGYEVDTATDGQAGLDKVRSKAYDVALLDLKMPGMDGLTLYRRIRQERADTVAMIVTAYATAQTKSDALQAGAWQVLSKPVDFARLLSFVESAVSQPVVMVVDDDKELCDSLWDTLRERDYRVCLAHTELEAARRLADREFQVVLVDLRLPDGDGRRVLDQIRQKNPQARSVLITGHRDEMEQSIQQALEQGVDAVCYKPFDVKKLLETIDKLAHRIK